MPCRSCLLRRLLNTVGAMSSVSCQLQQMLWSLPSLASLPCRRDCIGQSFAKANYMTTRLYGHVSFKLTDPRGPDGVLAEIKYGPAAALTAKKGILMQCQSRV